MQNSKKITMPGEIIAKNIKDILKDNTIHAFTEETKNIGIYALNIDINVLETYFNEPHFFLRKPFKGELDYIKRNYVIQDKILNSCCSIICTNENIPNNKHSITEISYQQKCKFRTKTFLNKKDTIDFFEEVKPFFFDGRELYIWEGDE